MHAHLHVMLSWESEQVATVGRAGRAVSPWHAGTSGYEVGCFIPIDAVEYGGCIS